MTLKLLFSVLKKVIIYENQGFNLFRFSGIFVITKAFGWIINSFETGFILGIIISLIFWQSE